MAKTNKEMALDFLKEQAKNEQNSTLASYYQEAVDALEKLVNFNIVHEDLSNILS